LIHHTGMKKNQQLRVVKIVNSRSSACLIWLKKG